VLKTNVILGSSVALGWKASGYYWNRYINGSASNSYGALLTQSMGTNGWWVMNKSVAGDATPNVIGRFSRDVPVGADEILIALSLGNEGLPDSDHPQAICDQFFAGITNLIAMSRQNGSIPLLGCIYPRDDFSPSEYGYVKNMVLRLNTLGVPNANFLGATDDGHGHWVRSLGAGDGLHPNDAGHYEMYLAIVPSVFDALKAGKPTPQWGNRDRFVHILPDANQPAPLSFTPDSTVHSFSMSFRVRTAATGTVASVTLPNSAIHPTIEITPTDLVYVATNGQIVSSGVAATNGAWHEVVVACQYAGRKTSFYVDGVLAGTVYEQLIPIGFVLGGHGSATTRPDSPAQADYQDWFVHRSMMNAEEVTAQHQGVLQQESLELYAPLDDPSFPQGCAVTNRAQSLSAATINGATLSGQPANFTGTPTAGTAPLTVTFTGPSTGSITNWFWDFGDGGTSNATTSSVNNTYTTAGVYSVTLIVSGPCGTGSTTLPNYITVSNCMPPVANFTGAATTGAAPLAVTFTDLSTGSITNWFWDFGDGNTTNTTANSVGDTYTTAGVYSVTMIVTGPCGTNSLTLPNYITVSNYVPPLANFTGTPTSGAEPLTVTFTGPSTGSITNWFWDFGDGNTTNVTTNSVVHTYTAGSYSVTLVTTDLEAVNTNSQSNYITALTAFQSWQMQYFNSTNGLATPDADPDGDGMNNLTEFLTGTDPTNGASAFRIITVIPQDSDILVSWEGCGGKTNAVQATPNLVDGFADISSNIILSGSGELTTNFLDVGAVTNASRLYRVRLVP
jgi:PKD repeat protein/lysophospholipase L1-like esterase